jgi:uncharacterized protein (DUF488 family)
MLFVITLINRGRLQQRIKIVMAESNRNIPSNIWTLGHSTRSIEEFIEILKSFDIETLADVRSLPGSNRFPHFNKEELKKSLEANTINYIHILLLGGRRKTNKDSKNTAWLNKSFRGYADYMETQEFKEGIDELLNITSKSKTAIMCAEAYWRKCHRSMISDYLKSLGLNVFHISGIGKGEEHKFTEPSKIVQGELQYK